MIAAGDVYSEDDLRKYRLQVQEHEETLKAKLAHLKQEALELAKHKQQFQVAKGTFLSIVVNHSSFMNQDKTEFRVHSVSPEL